MTVDGRGTVAREPEKTTYNAGEEVQLTATPDPGWIFSEWSGDVTGSVNPATITMDSNKIITATFIDHSLQNIAISYPHQYVLFQRQNDTTGEILITGSYEGSPTTIEASFNNGPWVLLDDNPEAGTFSGSFNASVGQGLLQVRFANDHSTIDSVSHVSIGDLFVIAGQSNAVGHGTTLNTLDPADPFIATAYPESDAWRPAYDPIDTRNGQGSPWPQVADYITQNINIPIAYISTAYDGASIIDWQKGKVHYNFMITQISEATHGTMRVRAMLYFQGEKDASLTYSTSLKGNYTKYKENLSQFASDFLDDTLVADTIIVGQIDTPQSGATRESTDNIRRAQRDSWDEDPNISPGPVTYDIQQTVDNLHFKTDAEISVFADRWWACIEKDIYGVGDNRGPQLDTVLMVDGDTLLVRFHESSPPIVVKDYLGNSASEPMGWRIVDGGTILTDSEITATLISDNEVQLDLNSIVSLSTIVSLGSYTDGYGHPVARDNSIFVLPAEPFSTNISAFVIYLQDIDSGLTSPTGTYRWLDVANQQYSVNYRNNYNYTQAIVSVTYNTQGNKLIGTLQAINLKPNFAYQLKLVGTPGTIANKNITNEKIGLAGRWWQEEWNGTAWTNGQNLNTKGNGSSPNPNDQVYYSRCNITNATSPTGLKYKFIGYLLFDYFITDEHGDATVLFETGSCHHVLWKTTQRSHTTNDGPLKTTTFTANTSSPAYDVNYSEQTITLFGEWERLPMGNVNLSAGEYVTQLILTEESFHGDGGQYAGNWAGAMGATIQFNTEES